METRQQRIAALVAVLDSPDHDDADGARFALVHDYGADAFDALLEAAPTLGGFGQVLAAEVFESIGDARALPILLPWLASEDPTLRQFALCAVGSTGSRDAIPALVDAWAASRSRGEPPSWSEPSIVRSVLARLGGREVVIPNDVRALAVESPPFRLAWPRSSLAQVLASLAAAGQVIVALSFWGRDRDTDSRYHVGGSTVLEDEQWCQPWAQLVAQSHDQALRDAKAMRLRRRAKDVVVVVDWIDERDR